MIAKNNTNNQLPTEIKLIFKELDMFKYLRNAGIKKFVGYPCSYIFQLIFCLIFENKNWFQMLQSKKAGDIPGKDTMYRFINKSTYNWRRFLLQLATHTIGKISRLTRHERPKVFILDDSSYDRNRSNKVELLARCFNNTSQKMLFYKGFRMLTLGWSDGATFLPIDFSLLSSKKSQINGISETVDKLSSGYKRRIEALQTAPEQIPEMITRVHCIINEDYIGLEKALNAKHDKLLSGYIKTSIKTLRKHLPYIKNTFNYPFNIGRIEGINNKIKILSRISYCNRNFIHYQNRILLHFNCKPINEKRNKRHSNAA